MKAKKAVFLGVVILMMLSLTFPLGCTNGAEIDSPAFADFETYSGYGFSFEYPKDYSIEEWGMLESQATDASGVVQAWRGDSDLYQVAWMGMVESVWDVSAGMQAVLDTSFLGVEQTEGVTSVYRGEQAETTHEGHPMLYQFCSIDFVDSDKVYGIQAVFYCDRNERVFQLFTMHKDITETQDVLEDFQRFADSVVCH